MTRTNRWHGSRFWIEAHGKVCYGQLPDSQFHPFHLSSFFTFGHGGCSLQLDVFIKHECLTSVAPTHPLRMAQEKSAPWAGFNVDPSWLFNLFYRNQEKLGATAQASLESSTSSNSRF